jgi:hypothetical protein
MLVLLTWLFSFSFLNFFSFEHLLSSDVSINDLHYRLERNAGRANQLSNQLILVNTGDIPDTNFRTSLALVITKLQKFNPKVIGIDHQFTVDDTNKIATAYLKSAIENNSDIILGYDKHNENVLKFNTKKGVVNFPENQISIRKYYNSDAAFAFQICSRIGSGDNKLSSSEEEFFINYVCDSVLPYDKFWDNGFCAFNSMDLLKNDSSLLNYLSTNGKGKAFLIGNLGHDINKKNNFDIEDKHKVPCDKDLVNREKSMYGLLIHANVIENILNPKYQFYNLTDSWFFTIIAQFCFMYFIYFCLYVSNWKLYNIIFLFALSVPFLYVVTRSMNYGIYIQSGLTLLEFLVIEEMIEILHPIENKILKRKKL